VNTERRSIAAEVFAAGREYDSRQADRLARYRNLEPETAELLGVLVRAMSARRVLEIGTSNGHSTLWLADAVEATGGQLESLDIDPRRTALAMENLERAGLEGLCECRTIGAAQALSEYPDRAWELIFLDAERPEYPGYWPNLRRTLAPGGLIAIDNAISHAGELTEFNRLLASDPDMTTTLVPIGAGVTLVVADR
jgi:predicted O-methyltransferase YrrM